MLTRLPAQSPSQLPRGKQRSERGVAVSLFSFGFSSEDAKTSKSWSLGYRGPPLGPIVALKLGDMKEANKNAFFCDVRSLFDAVFLKL